MSAVIELVREELRQFAGYSSARKEAGGGEIFLNANESPWSGASDQRSLNRYPQPQPAPLLSRLAELYKVPVGRLLVGRGSDEAIDLLTRALCRAGESAVIISPPTFGMYAVCAKVQGAEVISVPLLADSDFSLDVDSVIDALAERVRMVYVCSPNNPTGRVVATADLERLASATAGRALLVVDEAYAEFCDAPSSTELQSRYPHVATLRTLSKAYALAGARIGCLLADPALIAVLRSIIAPYPLPTPCVDAAMEALSERSLTLARSRIALIRSERGRLQRELVTLSAVETVFASDANFLLVRFRDTTRAYRFALEQGIVLRDSSRQPGLENCLRITVGTPEENQRLLEVLAQLPWSSAATADTR